MELSLIIHGMKQETKFSSPCTKHAIVPADTRKFVTNNSIFVFEKDSASFAFKQYFCLVKQFATANSIFSF